MGECDLGDIGVPSIFNIIRSPGHLVRMRPTLLLSGEENTERRKWKLVYTNLLNLEESGQFPDESVNNVMFIIKGKTRSKENTHKEVG